MILPKKGEESGTINTKDSAVNNLSTGFNLKVLIFFILKLLETVIVLS